MAGWRGVEARGVLIERLSSEEATLLEERLIRGMRGTVLEIGAGEGANFGFLDESVEWIGLEPDADDVEELRRKALRWGRKREPLVASAEDIPLPDASVDGVLSTLVFCSVADPSAALAEVRRVLRPGGELVFVEHVAARPGSVLRWVQGALSPLSSRFDRGCRFDRETVASIRGSGLEVVELHEYRLPSGLGFSVPFVAGRARRV